MGEIDIRELQHLLARLEEELNKGGELVLTRKGRPVARIVPIHRQSARHATSHADLRARMPKSGQASVKLVREDRNAR